MFGVDELDPISPLRDIELAGLTEVEQRGPGMVEQRKCPLWALRGDQV
jgi:hypothetical protein